MSGIDRRRFLQAGAVAGIAGVSGVGCGALPAHLDVPGADEMLSLDMGGFLKRLDASLGFIRSSISIDELIPAKTMRAVEQDQRFSTSDTLVRDALRSLLMVTSFNELPDVGQAHPGVQARMLGATDDLDRAVLDMHRTMKALTPTERADAARALREDPQLRARVLDKLDHEAEIAGVSPSRRAHMAKVGRHAAFRLQQSAPLFFDELDRKVEKVAAKEWSVAESEHRLRALMGEAAFEQKRARMLALAQAWQTTPGLAQAAPPPVAPAGTLAPAGSPGPAGSAPGVATTSTLDGLTPAPSPVAPTPAATPGVLVSAPFGANLYDQPAAPLPRGAWTLRAGGLLFGLAAIHGLQGLSCLLLGGAGIVPAMGEFTHGGLLIIGGIVTLIVGGVQSSKGS
jgi:hypothetical protein